MNKSSAFAKIMEQLDEKKLLEYTKKEKTDKWTKRFSTRDHLAAMIFAQLMNSRSLRELETQFNAITQQEYVPVKRSTLSDANAQRNYKVFEMLCKELISSKSQEINEVIRIMDSTPINVVGKGSEWAQSNANPRTKGLKVHVLYAPESRLLEQVSITHPNVNDLCVGKKWKIIAGSTYLFDKGYLDYNWWHKIHKKKAYFVTRIKKNTKYKAIGNRPLEKEDQRLGVLSDQYIYLGTKTPRGGKVNLLAETKLRLIQFYDATYNRCYSFVTNRLDISAHEVATFYKKRWDIELLFKWIKQNLRIKQLFGQSENAIKIQIYTALISYMLLLALKKKSKEFARMIDFLSWVKITIFSPMFTAVNSVSYSSGGLL